VADAPGIFSALRRLHWALFGAVFMLAAGTLLFTTFMVYDDEGYVLFSLQNFTSGGGLYERVYSQYGPFFFLFNQLLHFGGLGFDFTNTSARVLTGFYWLATTGLCGAMVWRVTRSHVASVLTVGGVFLHLWSMTSEPSHPGGLIAFLVALAAWSGIAWQDQAPKRWLMLGFTVAALALTKINVGVFLLVGAGAWWAIHLDETRLGLRWRVWMVGAALTAMPMALMRKQLGLEWVSTFAIVAGAAGAAAVLAAGRGATVRTHWRDSVWVILAGILVTLVTAIGIVAQGTSVHGLLEGVLLGPLRMPTQYLAQVNWRSRAVPLAVASLALASVAVVWLRPQVASAIAWVRLGGTAWYFAAWIFVGLIHPHAFAMSYALAFVWLFVLPLGGDEATQPARSWLALLLIPQALHAFPVAGSQIAWGTFLWVPLAAIAAHDAFLRCSRTSPAVYRVLATAAIAVLAGLTTRCLQSAQLGVMRVRESARLGLPGANALLLPESLASTLRALARNTVVHADVLFSMPGMHSFHLWTDVPAPTAANATHWFTLLSPAQQEAIRAKLAASPRSCVIVQRDVLDFLKRNGIATESPLAQWLQANYEPAFTLQTYEFWVRKGRTIAAINTASAREAAAGTTPRYQLSMILAETALHDVTSVELAKLDREVKETVATWTGTDAQIFATPLTSSGREAGPTRQLTFPFEASGLVRIDVRTDRFPPNFPFGFGVLYLRDRTGKPVAEARFVR
jgi:hypothetical protein